VGFSIPDKIGTNHVYERATAELNLLGPSSDSGGLGESSSVRFFYFRISGNYRRGVNYNSDVLVPINKNSLLSI
jgi:hypothetical protein